MLRYHMAVVTRDNALKREVKRVTTATGASADFIRDVSGFNPKKKVNLVIFDARKNLPDKQLLSKIPKDAHLIHILDGDSLIDRLMLFKDSRSTSLLCYDARFDDDEFISSATKALRGDVFGLQKYFPWGVTTFSMLVKNYDEKGRAIDILMRYAKLAGVRGPVRDRIQLVCDELMMNALYHAPTDEDGNEKYAGRSLKELAQLEEVNAIQVQYGCSGRYFGVSVRDGYGSLTRKRALDYLFRAKSGSHIETKAGGAGLGLVSVLKSVSKLVFNIDAGYSTEAIGLFDMELFAKGKVGARSLHIFMSAEDEEGEDEDEQAADEEQADEPRRGRGIAKPVLLAGLLFGVASAMGTAYYFKSANADTNKDTPSLTVSADPQNATVMLNNKPIRNGIAVPIPSGKLTLKVTAKGLQPWSKTLDSKDITANRHIYVNLRPKRR